MVRRETRILVSVTQGQELTLTPLPTHVDMNQWHEFTQKSIKNEFLHYFKSAPKLNDLLSDLHFQCTIPLMLFVWILPLVFWAFCDQTLVIDLIQIVKQDASTIWTLKCYFTLEVGKTISVHYKDAARRRLALVTIFVEGQNKWGEDVNKYYTTIKTLHPDGIRFLKGSQSYPKNSW